MSEANCGTPGVYRVDAVTGSITRVAGSACVFSACNPDDGIPANSTILSNPTDIDIDEAGNLFISDSSHNRIRRVDASTGIINAVAGGGKKFSGDDGPPTRARLNLPLGVVLDSSGNLIISDTFNQRIRRVDAKTGIITTVAGNGRYGFSGDNIPAVNERLSEPKRIALDNAGNIFIVDGGYYDEDGDETYKGSLRIRRVDARTGIITTVAGNGSDHYNSSDGNPAVRVGMMPVAVAVDKLGNLFISNLSDNTIKRVDAKTGVITTVVGNKNYYFEFSGDFGPALQAGLGNSQSLAIDNLGNLYIADRDNDAIRVVKGIANRSMFISKATLIGQELSISGFGLGALKGKVTINGRDISSRIIDRKGVSLKLDGSASELNLKNGVNQIIVKANGNQSNTFKFGLKK